MEYNEAVIQNFRYKDKKGDEAVEQWIVDNQYMLIDYTNTNYENIDNIERIDNYILKHIDSLKPDVKNFVTNYLNQVYLGFLKQPEIYITSPLLKDELVNKISASQYKEAFEKKKQEVSKSSWQIFQKSLTQPITDKEKDLLANFFIKMIDTKNEALKNAIDIFVKKIIRDSCIEVKKDGKIEFNYIPISKMNSSELRLVAFYTSRFVNKQNLIKNVHIVQFSGGQGGCYFDGIIELSKMGSGIQDMDMFLQCICHETQHAIQDYVSKKESSITALDYATHSILIHYLSTSDYSPYYNYKCNYKYSEIEKDANEMGYHYSSVLLSTLGLYHRMHKQNERKQKDFDSKKYEFSTKSNPQNQFVTLEEMQIDELRKIIKEHPELLNTYPVLQNFYTSSGEEKAFEKLIIEASKSSQGGDVYRLYKNHLIYQARQGSFSNLNLEKYSDDEKARIYITINKLLSDSTMKIESHAKRSQEVLKGRKKLDHDDANDVLIKTGESNISFFIKLISFVMDNYDEIKRLEEAELIPRNALFGTINIKGNLESIRNIDLESYDNLPYYSDLKLAQSLSNEIVQTIYIKDNKARLEEELEKYDDETLMEYITLSDGKSMTLKDYIVNYLLKLMNRHGFVVMQDMEQIDLSQAIQNIIDNKLQTNQNIVNGHIGILEPIQTKYNETTSRHL